jgi:hypothetical protein
MIRNPKSPVVAIVAYFALVGIISVSMTLPGQTQGNGGAAGPRVTVVNTTDNPVPVNVQNPLTVDTSTPLQVQVDTSNPLDVKVDSTTPVSVKVDSAEPISVTEKRQYLNFAVTVDSKYYDVPAGKKLIVQHVSGNGWWDDGYRPRAAGLFSVLGNNGNTVVNHYLPVAPSIAGTWNNSGFYEFFWSEEFSFTVPAGHRLRAFSSYFLDDTDGKRSIELTVSGYLVDAQ